MSGKVTYDLAPLHKFVKSMDNNRNKVRVGIFGDKNNRKDFAGTNASIGAIHEFGDPAKRIPARSFLRMPLFVKSEEILKEASSGMEKLLAEGKHIDILKRLGIACENAIQRAFGTRGFGFWKPNAPSTIRRKKSSAPLIDTRQLRASIASKVV